MWTNWWGILHDYAIDAAQWSVGPVYVCFGAANKRKAFKISSIIWWYELCICISLVGHLVCCEAILESWFKLSRSLILVQIFSRGSVFIQFVWAWWLQAVPQAFKDSFGGVSYEKCTGKWLSTFGNAWFFVVFFIVKSLKRLGFLFNLRVSSSQFSNIFSFIW